MNPADLSRSVVRALRCAVEDGELAVEVPERVVVERTRPGGVGEYATPVAFKVAKGAGVKPAEVAEVLARRLAGEAGISDVAVTGAGFLNFTLERSGAAALVERALRDGRSYGRSYGSADTTDRAADVPAGAGPRERAVLGAVLRIAAAQGLAVHAHGHPRPDAVAPVARRDGDVEARYGAGAARWAMLAVGPRETPVFGDLLLVQDESNEFFRVLYARSRCAALTRNAALLGFTAEPGDVDAPALLGALADHPMALEAAAHHREPDRLLRQLVVVADALLDFQYTVLPVGDEKPGAAHRARLALAEAAGTVLAGGLALLGIDAPELI
ncbi:ArgS-related anticodon-binding protein NrtL [Streptomyces sp. NPDC089799]|uniref:ArgS-related anticodon-binding protein NrtL n=1 Tax=Streptomyces sp. NPDC089799 TaxID=3155066 RepID=UPI00342DB3AF